MYAESLYNEISNDGIQQIVQPFLSDGWTCMSGAIRKEQAAFLHSRCSASGGQDERSGPGFGIVHRDALRCKPCFQLKEYVGGFTLPDEIAENIYPISRRCSEWLCVLVKCKGVTIISRVISLITRKDLYSYNAEQARNEPPGSHKLRWRPVQRELRSI